MKYVNIYLSGGMGDISYEEQMKWRLQVINAILYGDYGYKMTPLFFNPPEYYNFEEKRHKTEREIFEFELNQVRKSDLIIVNFNVPYSIGTAMELAIAKEHHIPVIGLNKDKVDLHPWLIECCTRICDDMHELVDHVTNFYLQVYQ